MGVLTIQEGGLSGLAPSFTAASSEGDTFLNDGQTVLYLKNGGSGSVTATVACQTACNYGVMHDAAVAVPAGEERIIGPFARGRFSNNSGYAAVTYSGVDSLTVAAIQFPGR
jgi:hypothetical protein